MSRLGVGVNWLGHMHRLYVNMCRFLVNVNRLRRDMMLIRLMYFNSIGINRWSVNQHWSNGLDNFAMRVSWVVVIVLRDINMDWLRHMHGLRVNMSGLRVSVDRFKVDVNRLNVWMCFGVLINGLWIANFLVQIMMINLIMYYNWLWGRVHGFKMYVMCLHLLSVYGFIEGRDLELFGYLQVITV